MMILKNTKSALEVLLRLILHQYFSKSFCVTIVSEISVDVNLPSSSTAIINPNSSGFLENLQRVSEMGCSDYAVLMRNPEMFVSVYEQVNSLSNTRRGDRKMVFLLTDNIDSQSLLNILKLKEISYVPDVLLVIPKATNSCATFDLVGHNFVGDENESNSPVYLDSWDYCKGAFALGANLYPNKMSNLMGKNFRVAAFTYKPYVILDLEEEPTGRYGTEMNIADEFCIWLNCTVVVVNNDVDEWGEIYDNGTGVGVLGDVLMQRADVGITALYSWYECYQVMDFTQSCVRTGITCVAPSPRLLPSWTLPLRAFNWMCWVTLLITLVYATLVLYMANGFSMDNVLIVTFGMIITQSQKDTGSWRIRSVTGWLLITGFVLDNAYQGGLASALTVPKYEPSVDTVHDIVERQLIWGAQHDAWVFSLMSSQEGEMPPKHERPFIDQTRNLSDTEIKKLVNLFRTFEPEVLAQMALDRKMALSVEKLPAGNFAIGNYITREALFDLTLMLEDLYFEHTVVMGRKNSPYMEKLNEFIGRLHETGLILAWETQAALRYMDFKVQTEMKYSRAKKEDSKEPLGSKHLQGVFYVFGFGIIVSILFLISEIIISKK